MAKESQGQKLEKNEKVRNKVIEWIVQEPSLTDYAIVQRLKDELKYKCSQPSIASWRKNYLPQHIQAHEMSLKTLTNQVVSDKIDIKLGNLELLNRFIADFEKRRDLLALIMPTYESQPSGTDRVIYINVETMDLEKQYQDMSKFILDLTRERDKITGSFSPYDVAIDTAHKMIEVFVLNFKPDEKSPEYKQFQDALVDFDNNLKERYQSDKK